MNIATLKLIIRKQRSICQSSTQKRFTSNNDHDDFLDNNIVKNERNECPWFFEDSDYLEDPHRHFRAMDSLRMIVD